MQVHRQARRPWSRVLGITLGTLVAGSALGASGCLDRPIEPNDSRTTSTIFERLTQSAVDKIDLLLAVDNSRSMADKQEILALAVPDLVEGLVNPACVDPTGAADPVKPGTPIEDCPPGMKREFPPVLDIHIGIISSSLGAHGAKSFGCGDAPSQNDRGHLLARASPKDAGFTVETYQDKGFLAWDPSQRLDGEPGVPDPGDGEADIEVDSAADLNSTALVPQLREMVLGVGQEGCGYEAQLESWYRFLVDPDPYASISVPPDLQPATLEGTDTTLLEQRADFLRPDSLLAIIVLSDENDCSIRDEGFGYVVANGELGARMWRPRSECATNPDDPCCLSCGQVRPEACPVDPSCDENGGFLTAAEDDINLRCFDQKRRFGIDFLYPTDRYEKGLSERMIQDRYGNMVKNPIFPDVDPDNGIFAVRDPGLVFLAGIVGVPWQDIARQDDQGNPDLIAGRDDKGRPVGGFKMARELRRPNAGEASTWDILVGDLASRVPPADPHMIESIEPRSGENPITGTPIAPDTAPNGTNPINGHEWLPKRDLQYACIFPLLPGDERDCSDPTVGDCNCTDPVNAAHNPLCEPNPADGGAPTLQVRAKAYPGLRELQLIRGLGDQGIVGSVCPAQLDAPDKPDFGYRPAIGAIIERLKTVIGGECLSRSLTPDDDGRVECLVLEARATGGACDCDLPARRPVEGEHARAAEQALSDPVAQAAGWDCVCEVVQIPNSEDSIPDGEEKDACQNSLDEPVQTVSGADVNGWCYVDATTVPPLGNPELVKECPSVEKRRIRFVGKGDALPGATRFITCSGE